MDIDHAPYGKGMDADGDAQNPHPEGTSAHELWAAGRAGYPHLLWVQPPDEMGPPALIGPWQWRCMGLFTSWGMFPEGTKGWTVIIPGVA